MSQDAVLGHVFSNKALLEEALTTPSFKMTSPGARDNQRLEFLGDAVLGLLATDWLYANSPSEEGDMSARRQHMVSASALCAAVAGKGFVAMLKRNKGAGELPETAKTVADAVEAVMVGEAPDHACLQGAEDIGDVRQALVHDRGLRRVVWLGDRPGRKHQGGGVECRSRALGGNRAGEEGRTTRSQFHNPIIPQFHNN